MKNKFLSVKSALVLFAEYSWRIALLLNGTSLYFSTISLKIILLNIFVSSLHAFSLISPQLVESCFLHFHCFTVALTN